MSQVQKALHYPIITGKPSASPAPAAGTSKAQAGPSFQDLFQQKLHEQNSTASVVLSRHAQQRTEQRGITLSDADLGRLGQAVEKAQDKGLKDTLVFMDSTAFIVNVPSRVVVTVVDSGETENTVFTNIDGAVIV